MVVLVVVLVVLLVVVGVVLFGPLSLEWTVFVGVVGLEVTVVCVVVVVVVVVMSNETAKSVGFITMRDFQGDLGEVKSTKCIFVFSGSLVHSTIQRK